METLRGREAQLERIKLYRPQIFTCIWQNANLDREIYTEYSKIDDKNPKILIAILEIWEKKYFLRKISVIIFGKITLENFELLPITYWPYFLLGLYSCIN